MLSRMTIYLSEPELQALQQMADREVRGVRDHARYLLRQEAIRAGLLHEGPQTPEGEDVQMKRAHRSGGVHDERVAV